MKAFIAIVLGASLLGASAFTFQAGAIQGAVSLPFPKQKSTLVAQACCKICRKGKACGDTCIDRDDVCHQPPGCACNG
jgi:hypothetical protein